MSKNVKSSSWIWEEMKHVLGCRQGEDSIQRKEPGQKVKRSTMAKANNKTHLPKARAKERMRANKNTRKTSRSPDRATAGAKTRTVSHMESVTESETTDVLKQLSTCTHDALKTWWQRLEFLACVAVTSGTTLRMQFIAGFWNGGRS